MRKPTDAAVILTALMINSIVGFIQENRAERAMEALKRLAGSGDAKTLPLFSPTTPQARMKAKTGFVLKDDDLIGLQSLQFFLTPVETCGHLFFEPEHRHSWPVSGCNPCNATNIAPVALSTLSQTAVLSEPQGWDHPNWLLPDQILKVVFPDDVSIVYLRMVSVESSVPAGVEVSEKCFLSDSRRESSLPQSCDLARTKRLSIPDAVPPKPAIRQQFSAQSMPPGLALPGLIAFLWLLQGVLNAKLSWIKYSVYFVNVQIFSAFVLVTSEDLFIGIEHPSELDKVQAEMLHASVADIIFGLVTSDPQQTGIYMEVDNLLRFESLINKTWLIVPDKRDWKKVGAFIQQPLLHSFPSYRMKPFRTKVLEQCEEVRRFCFDRVGEERSRKMRKYVQETLSRQQ